MSEESRAVEFRRMMTARASWERTQRFQAFPGDPAAKTAVDAAWLPVTDKDRGWDPPLSAEGTGTRTSTPFGPRVTGEGLQIP